MVDDVNGDDCRLRFNPILFASLRFSNQTTADDGSDLVGVFFSLGCSCEIFREGPELYY